MQPVGQRAGHGYVAQDSRQLPARRSIPRAGELPRECQHVQCASRAQPVGEQVGAHPEHLIAAFAA